MSGGRIQPILPGDPIRAFDLNRMATAANRVLYPQASDAKRLSVGFAPNIVLVKNESSRNVPIYGILEILDFEGSLPASQEETRTLNFGLVLSGVVPASFDESTGKYVGTAATLLEPLAVGEIGRAFIPDVICAYVDPDANGVRATLGKFAKIQNDAKTLKAANDVGDYKVVGVAHDPNNLKPSFCALVPVRASAAAVADEYQESEHEVLIDVEVWKEHVGYNPEFTNEEYDALKSSADRRLRAQEDDGLLTGVIIRISTSDWFDEFQNVECNYEEGNVKAIFRVARIVTKKSYKTIKTIHVDTA